MKSNSTFRGDDPTWANACVGKNGNPDYMDYARGFSAAANMLLNNVLAEEHMGLVDLFIYPVCFNMRHSVELRLKHAVTRLTVLAKYRSMNEIIDLPQIHDIAELWREVKRLCAGIDDRFSFFTSELDPIIGDISEIDSTGQTFRYPEDIGGAQHLENVGVINFFVLRQQFHVLEVLLDYFDLLSDALTREYGFGTYTPKLSRGHLLEIAWALPDQSQWGDFSFNEIRDSLKAKYGVSSRELSRGICKIKLNHELAHEIGISLPLIHLTAGDLQAFFDAWCELHNLDQIRQQRLEISSVDLADQMALEKLFREAKRMDSVKEASWAEQQEQMTPEKIADLMALYYSCTSSYSEEYLLALEIHLKSVNVSDERRKGAYMHILEKTDAYRCILRTLYLLRQNQFAEFLVRRYDLENLIDWLDQAREQKLFIDPCRKLLADFMTNHGVAWLKSRTSQNKSESPLLW
jgi:hypothetical protein